MKKTVNLRVAVATAVFMMAMSLMSVNGQFLYRSSHLFLGPLPTHNDPSYVGTKPNFFIGPKFGIEYNYNSEGGLDFFIAWPESNWGQYKLHIDDTGNVGVGRRPSTSGSYKLDVDGVVRASSVVTTSDEKLKRNIKDMEVQRSEYVTKIRQLKGKSYEKLTISGKGNAAEVEQMVAEGKIPKEKAQEALSELNARKKDTYKSEYGFIAQDVKNLFPELVEEDAEGIFSLNYTGLIPVLLEAIKDLQDRVEQLEKQQGDNGGISIRSAPYPAGEDVAESGGSNEYLSQNTPNPVDGSTVIRYSLPEGATQAAIAVYSTGGSVAKIIPLDAKVKSGSITLYASDLSKGINVYNLTANGIVLGSRKMINP
jgi:hypothetical protein